MQTTLLGLAGVLILALIAALVGPFFIDWNQFRPQFETEAARIVGLPVRVTGQLDARLLPTPTLRLRQVSVGGANDFSVGVDKLDVEFSLGSLMRGEWRASELALNGLDLDAGLDWRGRLVTPVTSGPFNLGALAIDRLTVTGRAVLRDSASSSMLRLDDIAFAGDVRALAGSMRGDGNVSVDGERYPFRLSSSQSADGNGARIRLGVDALAQSATADLEGLLTFEAGAPKFDGSVALARAVVLGRSAGTDGALQPSWRVSAKVKGDAAAARFDQLEASWGSDDVALKLTGLADMQFGASPQLHAVLSAKQLDADRLLARQSASTEPTQLIPGLRALVTGIPAAPLPAAIEISADSVTLGGRPVQNIGADVRSSADGWTIEKLELRAPGGTRVALSGSLTQPGPDARFSGALAVDSSDPDSLSAWLRGRGDVSFRTQRPMRVRATLGLARDAISLDALKADIDGGALEGRLAFFTGSTSRLDANIKAERFDFDAAANFARSMAGPQNDWPDEAQLTLDVGAATWNGRDLREVGAQGRYTAAAATLERFSVRDFGGVMLDGAGAFDRNSGAGKLTLDAVTPAMTNLASLVAPLSPVLATRMAAASETAGAVKTKIAIEIGGSASRSPARATLDLESAGVKGMLGVTSTLDGAALRALDVEALTKSEIALDLKLASGRGPALLALLGLDRVIADSDKPLRFEATAKGDGRAPLRVSANLRGTGVDAELALTGALLSDTPKASGTVTIREADLGALAPASGALRSLSGTSRIAIDGDRISLDDLDGRIAGSRARGRLSLMRGIEPTLDGELGIDAVDLATILSVGIGAGADSAKPLAARPFAGWRGKLAFQALRGSLPGGAELRPVSGVLRSNGAALSFDAIKGSLGGGTASADIQTRQTDEGLAIDARVQLDGVEGTALRYRGLTLPAGRTGLQMTLSSRGRSASALVNSLAGNGSVSLSQIKLAGLDPRVFDSAVRASDSGQIKTDAALRALVEQGLAAGSLTLSPAQIPYVIKDGRLRVGTATLDGDGARLSLSGGFDLPADQIDIRAVLTSATDLSQIVRPDVQVFLFGTPDRLNRSLDVTSLSSFLAVRAIDRETRRLDQIERGIAPSAALPSIVAPEPAPVLPQAPPRVVTLPPVPPASEAALPQAPPPAVLDDAVPAIVPVPRAAPTRPLIPRPAALPAAPSGQSNGDALADQRAPALPPPIDIRPAPGVLRAVPKARPPIALTPPAPVSPRLF